MSCARGWGALGHFQKLTIFVGLSKFSFFFFVFFCGGGGREDGGGGGGVL